MRSARHATKQRPDNEPPELARAREQGADGDGPEDQPADQPPDRGGRSEQPGVHRGLVKVLIVTGALLGALALCFGIAAYGAQQAISRNVAHVSGRSTEDVAKQVGDTLAKAFSYDYAKAAETRKVVEDRLQGQALAEYERLFAPVKEQARPQKLVLTTTVKSAGVISLSDERARVLVFADQFAVRAGTDEYSGGPAQLEATAEKDGDTWEITSIRVL